MAKDHIRFIFEPRNMLLSLQIGFSFVRVEVSYAIIERNSPVLSHHLRQQLQVTRSLLLYPASVSYRHLPLHVTGLVFISLVLSAVIPILFLVQFCSAVILILFLVQVLFRLFTLSNSSCSSSTTASMSSAYRRLIMVLPLLS